jgi:Fur family peroxide stress response transcriptional regulator
MITNLESIETILKGTEIKPTYQRFRILKYLKGNKIHPSADMIYKTLVGEIPSASMRAS